jgi:putative ABC transport system permease protein
MIRNSHDPPRSALRILEWFCRAELLEEVRGDLDEAYSESLRTLSARRAGFRYWIEVLFFIRSHTVRRTRSHTHKGPIMLRNYLNVALRSMRRQKAYSTINLLGLAVGLAATFLITLYVEDELSFDTYHPDADRIYRLVSTHQDESYEGIAKINGPWGTTAAQEIAEIEAVSRFLFFGTRVLEYEGQRQQVHGGFYADSTVFDVFSWSLVAGDPETALVAPFSMIVSRSFSESVFGQQDPMGRSVLLDGSDVYTITGLVEDVPENSHFTFTFLASMSGYSNERHDDWVSWNQYYTYLKLRPGADPAAVGRAATDILPAHMLPEQAEAASPLLLQPLEDIYLRTRMFREIATMGDRDTVNLFALLAGFILLLASVNFVNLATARASNRSREVGVRKSLGAARGAVIRQFLTESVLTVFLSALIACVLVLAALSTFNAMSGKVFTVGDVFAPANLTAFFVAVVALGLIAGTYPAFVLSGFRPAAVLKGTGGSRGGVRLRRSLVAIQFVVSATLIMASGVVADQQSFVQNKSLGFDKEALINVSLQDNAMQPRFDQFKRDLASVPGVVAVALSANRPGGGDYGIPMELPGEASENQPPIRMLIGDADFPSTYGLTIVQGRDFDINRATDQENGLLINQEMARRLNWDMPIGKRVLSPVIDREFEVIGVIEDFHFRSVHQAIAPVAMFSAPAEWYSLANIRLRPGNIPETLEAIEAVYERYDALNPFAFSFVDEQFASLYSADRQIGQLLNIATFLALFVACLGLFGLASHAAERRKKEIGVRKAIGASLPRIIGLLTKETAILLGVALVVGTPLAVLFGQSWLDRFAYHISINPLTMLAGALITALLALLTSGFQAWRAGRMDPVRALRTE